MNPFTNVFRSRQLLGPVVVSVLLCVSPGGVADVARVDGANDYSNGDESLLLTVLDDIGQARLDTALASLEELLARNPRFRLAQLVYGDLLLAKATSLPQFGAYANGRAADIAGLRDEARMRLQRHLARPPDGGLPKQLLELSPDQKRAIFVDVAASRLYLFENDGGRLSLIRDYYVSTGKKGAMKSREGDQKTPTGVYFITSQIPSAELPDFYGTGAFPVDYPNEWDVRLGRTGYGIWLHGVPSDTYSRVPRASDGCVALANDDFSQLWDMVESGRTPVILSDGIEWADRERIETARLELRGQLESWRQDWESRDVDRYSRFYSSSFRSPSKDRRAWIKHKRRVNASKRFIEVGLSKVSLLGYPGEDGLVVVTFEQDYRSSNFKSLSQKRQYWRKEGDGVWRIVYEGTVRLRPEHIRGIPYSARSKITRVGP